MQWQLTGYRSINPEATTRGILKNIRRKRPMLESLFNKASLFKRGSNTGVSCVYCELFKNSFFIAHLRWQLLAYWLLFLESCEYLKLAIFRKDDWPNNHEEIWHFFPITVEGAFQTTLEKYFFEQFWWTSRSFFQDVLKQQKSIYDPD